MAHAFGCSWHTFGSQRGSWLAPSLLVAERYQLAPSMCNLRLSPRSSGAHSVPILTVKWIGAADSASGNEGKHYDVQGDTDLLRGC